MSDSDGLTAMRRKAGAGRPPPEIGRMTAATALRVAVAQAAEDVAALVALAAGVEEERGVRDDIIAALPEHALLVLVEGTGNRFGLAVMDPQTLAALVEIQTTGRVVPNPAEPRSPTRTDAILAADFIDRMLELFEEIVGEADLPVAPAIEGFRYAMPLADCRAAAMTLEDVPYRHFTLTMDLGGGAKTGQVQLIFPYAAPRRQLTGAEGGDDTTVEATVMDSQAEMQAILHRLEMPLHAVSGLTVGSLVPVPREALGQVHLEAVTGTEITVARLGQQGGYRAVCIADEPAASEDVMGQPASSMMGAAGAMPSSLPSTQPMGDGGLEGLGDLDGLGDPGGLADLGEAAPMADLSALGAVDPVMGNPPSGGLADLGGLDDGDGLPPIDIGAMGIADLPEPVG